jgi:glycosyltransferase involved in cell wall biosynthesis
LGLTSEDLSFLFIGNIRPYKGVLELIEAFQKFSPTGARLVIAGRPVNQETGTELERRIAEDERIQLHLRFIADEEMQVFLNACDVVVFPYRKILTSGAVILAMSFGRACIAPAMGCITEVLDERGAILYDADRPDGLREALSRAVVNRDRLKEMGAHNLARAAAWSRDRVAGQTAGVYRDALA